jgi:hypothetical protein
MSNNCKSKNKLDLCIKQHFDINFTKHQLIPINMFSRNNIETPESLKIRIVHTSVLHFIPQLKMHHIILIPNTQESLYQTNQNVYKNVYVIDFSPINQSHPAILLKLLFAINVPGEIRIRRIRLNKSICYTDDQIVNIWYDVAAQNYTESKKISNTVFSNIRNLQIKKFITKIKEWNSVMNLYTHNCQHFSKYAKELLL